MSNQIALETVSPAANTTIRSETQKAQAAGRAKKNRRRMVDPTTCERDYSDDEVEFMKALDDYKRKSGRMFPTCSEMLEVLRALGYQKQPQVDGPTIDLEG